jgi:hypothetical protein
MHFMQIRRRILKIKPSSVENLGFEEEHEDHNDDNDKLTTLIVDGSSLTISKKIGDYILRRNGYMRKKEFIKLHIAVDEDPKVISYKE